MRKFLILPLLLILLAAAASAELTTDLEAYYKSDTSGSFPDATPNGNDGTIQGATYTSSGFIQGAYDYDGTNDVVALPNIFTSTSEVSISAWLKKDTLVSNKFPVVSAWDQSNNRIILESRSSLFQFVLKDGSTQYTAQYNIAPNTSQWYHMVGVYDTNHIQIYINGEIQDNVSISGTSINSLTDWEVGGWHTYFFDGVIDEVAIYNRKLTASEVSSLYNSGSGKTYPFPTGQDPLELESQNYTPIRMLTYNATIDSTDYSTTNGTIITSINDSSDVSIDITGPQGQDIFLDTSYNSTKTPLTFNYTALNFTATDSVTNASISSFIAYVRDFCIPTWCSPYGVSTNTGNATVFTQQGETRNLTISAPGYVNPVSISNTYAQGVQNITFTLDPANTIYVRTFNQSSGALITGQTVTISYTGPESDTVTTTNGEKYIQNLTSGNYSITVSSDGFSDSSYTVTVGNSTFSTLDAFLGSAGDTTVTFTVTDQNSGQTIPDATISMYADVNGTSTLISTRDTDITGRTRFDYTEGTDYTFTITHPDYITKSFDLNPILFDSYTVRLQKDDPAGTDPDFFDVSIDINPRIYYNNATNNISVQFSNPAGDLLSYGFNATFNSTTVSQTAYNSYGSILTDQISINGANDLDRVKLTIFYQKSNKTLKSFTYYYDIAGTDDLAGTALANEKNPYNLVLFDRIVIVVLVAIISAGIVFLLGGELGALTMAILVLSYFAYIAFIPMWAIVISIVSLILTAMWRFSQ